MRLCYLSVALCLSAATATIPIYVGSYRISNAKGIAVATSNNFYVGSGSTISLYNQSGYLISSFGTAGTGNGQFNNIKSIAYDPVQNNIAVLDSIDANNGRLQVVNTAGAYQWDYKGSAKSVNDVQQVTFDSHNNNYYFVSAAYNRAIAVTSNNGTFVNNVRYNAPSQRYHWGVAFNPKNNNIYLSNNWGGGIYQGLQRFTESGTYVSQVSTNQIAMVGIDPSTGNVYAQDGITTGTFIYDQDNNYLGRISGYGGQTAFDPGTGKIYIAQGNNVAVFFNPDTWTQSGTCQLSQLSLDQDLTLASGYNLNVSGTLTLSNGANLTLNQGGVIVNNLTFNNGTLNLQSPWNTVVGNPITLNGPATIAGSSNVTLNGVVIGSSPLTITNTSGVTLNGANTYSGGTVINGGSVAVGNDTALGTGGVSLSGTLQADASSLALANNIALTGNSFIDTKNSTLTYSGTISGTSSVKKVGSGTLIITGANKSTGDTILSTGTLQIGDGITDGSIDGNIVNNASLNFNQANTRTFGGTVTGSGTVTKIGKGKLCFSSTQAYSGATTINDGELQLKGSLNSASSTMVVSGATLSATGTVSMGQLTSSGTVKLEVATDTLTINGDYTLNANALHQVQLDSAGRLSLVHATGNASLNGNMLILPADNNGFAFKEGQEYILLQADGTLTDNLQSMSIKGASFLNYEKVIKNGHTLIFKVKSNSLTSQTNTSSFGVQNAASQALINTLSDRMVLFATVSSQGSSSQGGTVPGQGSSGEEENAFAFMHNNLRAQVKSRTQPSRSLLQTGPAPKDEALARLLSTMESQGTQALKKDAYTLWVSALYTQGKNDKTAISSASSDHQHGAVVGFEYVTPNKQLVGISVAAGLGHAHARANRNNKSDHKYSQIGVYHSVEFLSNTWLNSQLAYSYMRSENQRLAISPIGSSFLAHSASRLHSLNLVEELAYAMKLTHATTLWVGYGFNYWRLHRGAYGEGGAGALAQFFPRITRHGFAHQATARLHYGWSTESYHLGLAGSLKYALTVSGYRLKNTVYTVGGPDAGFAITAPGLGRGTLSPSLTFSGQHKGKGPMLYLSYTANLQVKRKAHELYLEARWSF